MTNSTEIRLRHDRDFLLNALHGVITRLKQDAPDSASLEHAQQELQKFELDQARPDLEHVREMSPAVRTEILGKELRRILDRNLDKEMDLLERPQAAAHMYASFKHDRMTLGDMGFENMLDAFCGQVAKNWVEPYKAMHASLCALGFSTSDNRLEFGTDAYIWACADRVVATDEAEELRKIMQQLGLGDNEVSPCVVKALALQTQSRSYIIVLNEKFGRTHLHIRRYWDDLREERAAGGNYLLQELDDKSLSLDELIAHASEAADYYGDDVPGVSLPERPHLATFLAGSLVAGSEQAGIGLRYGDFRDRGYVLSLKNDEERPEVDKVAAASLAEMNYVSQRMAHAMDALSELSVQDNL